MALQIESKELCSEASARYYQLPTLSPRSNPEDSVDSCIDITSPTPSNSTNSSNSRAEAEAKDTDDPSLVQRPNPLGCSGSSEEGGVVVAVDKSFSSPHHQHLAT